MPRPKFRRPLRAATTLAFILSLPLVPEAFPALAADDPKSPSSERPQTTDPATLLSQYDKNKDGFLDKSEVPDWLSRPFERIDTNGDGKLSKAELDAVADRLAQ